MFITKQDIRKSKLYNWVVKFCNTNFVAKAIVIFIIWGVALIPTDIFLLVRWMIGPEGFWQELALILVSAVVIGWLQGILLFFAIILSLMVAAEGV